MNEKKKTNINICKKKKHLKSATVNDEIKWSKVDERIPQVPFNSVEYTKQCSLRCARICLINKLRINNIECLSERREQTNVD